MYGYALYTSFFLFCVGEVVPRNSTENFMAIIALVVSSMINGFVIGNMALYIYEMNKINAEFQR